MELVSLLLQLVLQKVDSAQELSFGFDGLGVAEPKGVHLDLCQLQVALTTAVRTYERYLLCELRCFEFKDVRLT